MSDIFNKEHTMEFDIPGRVIDESMSLDISVMFYYRLKFVVVQETSEGKLDLNEETLKDIITNEIRMAYYTRYGNGMTLSVAQADLPEKLFVAEIRGRIASNLNEFYGAILDSFEFEKQWISEEDKQMIEMVVQANELRDPKKAAEALLKQMPQTWTCVCGSVNNGNFCPKCGKPAPGK